MHVCVTQDLIARRLLIGGRVQGVGFRPFVWRLATRLSLTGWVQNVSGEVAVHVEGNAAAIEAFATALVAAAPPIAKPVLLANEAAAPAAHETFAILDSAGERSARASVPPDYFVCDDCLSELRDPAARRHRYPFINCTQCGPRYTLIRRLPYDRPHTAMDRFALCPACAAEYSDPGDRRFHAQPLACPACGPQVRFTDGGESATGEAALARCIAALRAGDIVAVKGVGGYHLLCDAGNETAVARLRARKPRPHKPLAVLFAQEGEDGLAALRRELAPTPAEASLLSSPERPIVLCARQRDSALAPSIAPGLDEIGAMLPYSPLHHLLLADFGAPLVATSGNVGGEPVIIDETDAGTRLVHVVESFLHHNRPILRPADDSVHRIIAGVPRPLRLGRGIAPRELALPQPVDSPMLAVGGHTKNTVALAVEDRIILSPHVGDLDSPRAREVMAAVAQDLQNFYGVRATRLICDAHPHYGSTRWARAQGLPVQAVFHHHAHASGLYAEHEAPDGSPWLVFAWDGVGLGPDGTLWGGEALLGKPGQWQRVGSLRPFRLPGGEKAGREPWRSAAALCWETGTAWPQLPQGADLLHRAWQQEHNAPVTTAVGRLFDAAAALTGVVQNASFEGQGPLWLEARAVLPDEAPPLPLRRDADGLWRMDWAPLLPALMDESTDVAARAGLLHARLAATIAALAKAIRDEHGITTVGLAGGVFQNRRLTERAIHLLENDKFTWRLGERIPCNDGGLSFGQLAEVLWSQNP